MNGIPSSRAPLWVSAAQSWHPPVPEGPALYDALRLRKATLSRQSAVRPGRRRWGVARAADEVLL